MGGLAGCGVAEDFCNFSIKITFSIKIKIFNKNNFSIKKTFYSYFGQNSYFKAITHQIKAFKISLMY